MDKLEDYFYRKLQEAIEERENDVRKLEEKLAKIKELIETDKVFKRQCEEALENVEKEMEGR